MPDNGRHSEVMDAATTVIKNIEQAAKIGLSLGSNPNISNQDIFLRKNTEFISKLSGAADSITQSISSYVEVRVPLGPQQEDIAKNAILTIADDVGHQIIKPLHFMKGSISTNGKKGAIPDKFEPLHPILDAMVSDISLIFTWLVEERVHKEGQPISPFPESLISRMGRYKSPKTFTQYMSIPLSTEDTKRIKESAPVAVSTPAPPKKLTKQPQVSHDRPPSSQSRLSGLFRRSSSATSATEMQKGSLLRRYSTLVPASIFKLKNRSEEVRSKDHFGKSGLAPRRTELDPNSSSTATSSSSLASSSSPPSESGQDNTNISSPATSISSVSLNDDSCDTQADVHTKVDSAHTSQSTSPLELKNRHTLPKVETGTEAVLPTDFQAAVRLAPLTTIRNPVYQLARARSSDDGSLPLSYKMAAPHSRKKWSNQQGVVVSSPLADASAIAKPIDIKDHIVMSSYTRRGLQDKGRICPGSVSAQSQTLHASGTVIAIPTTTAVHPPTVPSLGSSMSSRRSSIDQAGAPVTKRKWYSIRRSSSRASIQQSEICKAPVQEAAWKCNTCPCVIPLGVDAPDSAINGAACGVESHAVVKSSLAKTYKVNLALDKTDPVAAKAFGKSVSVSWRWSFLAKSHATHLYTTSELGGDSEQNAKSCPYVCIFCANDPVLASSLGSQAGYISSRNFSGSHAGSSLSTTSLGAGPKGGPAMVGSQSNPSLTTNLGRQLHMQRLHRQSLALNKPGAARVRTTFPLFHDAESLMNHIVTTHAYDAQFDKVTRSLLTKVASTANCVILVKQPADAGKSGWDIHIDW